MQTLPYGQNAGITRAKLAFNMRLAHVSVHCITHPKTVVVLVVVVVVVVVLVVVVVVVVVVY